MKFNWLWIKQPTVGVTYLITCRCMEKFGWISSQNHAAWRTQHKTTNQRSITWSELVHPKFYRLGSIGFTFGTPFQQRVSMAFTLLQQSGYMVSWFHCWSVISPENITSKTARVSNGFPMALPRPRAWAGWALHVGALQSTWTLKISGRVAWGLAQLMMMMMMMMKLRYLCFRPHWSILMVESILSLSFKASLDLFSSSPSFSHILFLGVPHFSTFSPAKKNG